MNFFKIKTSNSSENGKSNSKEGEKSKANKLAKNPDLAMTEGMNLYNIGNFKKSIQIFDLVDRGFNKKKEKENALTKFVENAAKVVTNDRITPYTPWMYERIMVNTMKAIDFLLEKDLKHSRIEFNRAIVRELEAENEFRKEIEKAKRDIQRETEKDKNRKKNSSLYKEENLRKTVSFIEKYYSNLKAFKAYNGFLNPFTDYIAGIYFLTQGDPGKATNLLKECYGMIKDKEPADRIVKEDFKEAFNLKSSLKAKGSKHYTWIVLLNGRIGQRKEKRIDVPLFIFTKKVMYTGLALPDIKDGVLRSHTYYLKPTTHKEKH